LALELNCYYTINYFFSKIKLEYFIVAVIIILYFLFYINSVYAMEPLDLEETAIKNLVKTFPRIVETAYQEMLDADKFKIHVLNNPDLFKLEDIQHAKVDHARKIQHYEGVKQQLEAYRYNLANGYYYPERRLANGMTRSEIYDRKSV
jgi:hypothetical protein